MKETLCLHPLRTGISRLTFVGIMAAALIAAILFFNILHEPFRERCRPG